MMVRINGRWAEIEACKRRSGLSGAEFALALVIGGMVALLLVWASWTFAGCSVTIQDCIEFGRLP